MIVLGIETSCDETSISVVSDGTKVLSNVVHSQIEDHKKYGGVIPELGARKHLENITWVFEKAIKDSGIKSKDIKKIAVSSGKGLVPALNIGKAFAKGLSLSLKVPLVYIDHVIAHTHALFLESEIPNNKPKYPLVVLTVSGGHTQLLYMDSIKKYQVYGNTLDDSAGESFDKVAKLLGLGYPGGPIIDRLSQYGDERSITFPKPMINSNDYNFSFSGLKTAVLYYTKEKNIKNYIENPKDYKEVLNNYQIYDIISSFQESVVDVLVNKAIKLAKRLEVENIGISGGVSANSRLRTVMGRRCNEENINFYYPEIKYCTDNAAMIAGMGSYID